MSTDLIQCAWDGTAFVPETAFHRRRASERFGEGEVVMMDVQNERSWKTHAHQFASIADLWANLPEDLAEMPYAKSADALRKHALIATGFCDCETIDAGSKAAAERVAASLSRIATRESGYCVVKVSGSVVRCFTPHSQKARAMAAGEFQRSKTAVLEWIEGLIRAARIGGSDAAA